MFHKKKSKYGNLNVNEFCSKITELWLVCEDTRQKEAVVAPVVCCMPAVTCTSAAVHIEEHWEGSCEPSETE